MTKAAASRSWTMSTVAPIAKAVRSRGGTLADAASAYGLARSSMKAAAPAAAPIARLTLIGVITAAVSVNPTTAAGIESVARVNATNQCGTADMQTARVLGKHADAASRTAAFYMAIRAPTVGIFLFRVTSHGVRHSRVPPPKRPQKSLDGS